MLSPCTTSGGIMEHSREERWFLCVILYGIHPLRTEDEVAYKSPLAFLGRPFSNSTIAASRLRPGAT